MIPNNVLPLFINGDRLEYVLFKCAIHYAEMGLSTWFISPQQFNQLPEDLEPPDKEILKLITFLYLKDQKDLLTHLNGIHLWHKCPKLIILNSFEHYSKLSSEHSMMNAAFVAASLLDATSACARKHGLNKAFLLVACDIVHNNSSHLNILTDMYFPHTFSYRESSADKAIVYIRDCFGLLQQYSLPSFMQTMLKFPSGPLQAHHMQKALF